MYWFRYERISKYIRIKINTNNIHIDTNKYPNILWLHIKPNLLVSVTHRRIIYIKNDKMITFIIIIITSIMLKISGQLALCDFPLMTLGIRRYVLKPLEDSSISNNNSVNISNSNISSISITIGIKCVGEMPTSSLGIKEEKTCLWFLQQQKLYW